MYSRRVAYGAERGFGRSHAGQKLGVLIRRAVSPKDRVALWDPYHDQAITASFRSGDLFPSLDVPTRIVKSGSLLRSLSGSQESHLMGPRKPGTWE